MNKKLLMLAPFLGFTASSFLMKDCSQQERSAESNEPDSPPNIVFFEVDDLMYRFMGDLGRGYASTPNLDELAERGVYFQNAVCQGMMSGPSRNSLITGLYPHNLGFYINGEMGKLPPDVWNLPAALRRSGYNTSWIGKSHVHPYKENYKLTKSQELMQHMGFDTAIASVGRVVLARNIQQGKNLEGDPYIHHLKQNGWYDTFAKDCREGSDVTSLPEDHYLDGFYTNEALKRINQQQGDDPFFLWLNLSCPHGPYDVPQKYHDMYANKDIPEPLTSSFGEEIPGGLLKKTKKVGPQRAEKIRRGFAANTTFIDAMLGKVIDRLKADGEYENTVFVFFSDHGVFLGNHGRIHKGTVFNEITNPCLVVSYPKAFRQNVVEEQPVELLGIVQTALDIAGASEQEKQVPYGESLMPLLSGEGEYETDYVFSEVEGFQSCFDGRYRYIANEEKPLLYDLKNDPGEMRNIARERPELVEKMQRRTDRWLEETQPVLPANGLRDEQTMMKWKRSVAVEEF